MMTPLWVPSLVVVALVMLPVAYDRVAALSGPPSAESIVGAEFRAHIDHIVFVVLENHAYDSYFGVYCLVHSPACPYLAHGIPAGACVPYNASNPTGPCIRPWSFTPQNWTITQALPHGLSASTQAWNNGAMDGFYAAEHSGLVPFGHYNGTTAPIYWDLAQEYSLSDDFFSSVLDYSLPNHWHIVAGQEPAQEHVTVNGGINFSAQPASVKIANNHQYLNESNSTRSIEDPLAAKPSVSWDYYDFAIGNYSKAIAIDTTSNGKVITHIGGAYNYWNPQAAKNESYTAPFASHFVTNTQYYSDARNGTLPDLSWVIPPGQMADHPPNNSTLSQSWLASVVDALEASPDWNTTAMFVTWDDYGGFYDHVDPPMMNGQQLGFRVPLIVISPYTAAGAVSHRVGYFESILHLMEWRFGLGCITSLDCNAPLPMWGFNFAGPPRAPVMFPTNFSEASYPFNPAWNGSSAYLAGGYVPPTEFTYFPDGEAPDVD